MNTEDRKGDIFPLSSRLVEGPKTGLGHIGGRSTGKRSIRGVKGKKWGRDAC